MQAFTFRPRRLEPRVGRTGGSAPVVRPRRRGIGIGTRTERRGWQAAAQEIAVGVIFEFTGPDRWQATDKDQGLLGAELQDLANSQQRTWRFLFRHGGVRQPGRKAAA